jgi:nucleoside-diphosphate-sugar epimerase
MARNLVFMTGVTGHIGFRTLVHALRAGYSVRAAVRSQSKADMLLSHPKITPYLLRSRLTFVIVPDLTVPCAFDDAVRGCTHVVHIASPLKISADGDEIPLNEQDTFFILPAVRGTRNILKAAAKSGTVTRVVITSSMTALAPVSELTGEVPRRTPISPTDRVPFTLGPYEDEFAAYAASKVAALQEAERWMSRNPHRGFDITHLHPAFVQGRNDLVQNARDALAGTNALILGIALGKRFEHPIAGATAHLDDVARAHVRALDRRVPGDMSYILSQETYWNDIPSIVKREFPDARLPSCGAAETLDLPIDARLTEQVFGFRHVGLDEQVKSVVGHYLELRATAKSRAAAKRQDNAGRMGRSRSIHATA